MIRRNDPRIRQTINQISQNLESANETAQEGFYNFSHEYLAPCFSGIKECVGSCTAPCFGSEGRLRRRSHGRWEGRAELNFDFYDDWDFDEGATGRGAFFGWGNDELDRLLAGSGSAKGRRRNAASGSGAGDAHQPRRQRAMSYGTRGGRRKSNALPSDERQDPTVIPSSSFLGFLERLPWRIGARGVRYRPSAADLQENPGRMRRDGDAREHEPLMEESDEDEAADEYRQKQGRPRSGTQSSRETSNSLSSRGDLIPSDEEGDAVPLDDEFAMVLERRGTGPGDPSRDKFGQGRRSASGTSTRATVSSRDSKSTGKGKGRRDGKKAATKSIRSVPSDPEIIETTEISSLVDLKNADEQARLEEEAEIERKRIAAQKLAASRGLDRNEGDDDTQPSPFPDLPSPSAEAPPSTDIPEPDQAYDNDLSLTDLDPNHPEEPPLQRRQEPPDTEITSPPPELREEENIHPPS